MRRPSMYMCVYIHTQTHTSFCDIYNFRKLYKNMRKKMKSKQEELQTTMRVTMYTNVGKFPSSTI